MTKNTNRHSYLQKVWLVFLGLMFPLVVFGSSEYTVQNKQVTVKNRVAHLSFALKNNTTLTKTNLRYMIGFEKIMEEAGDFMRSSPRDKFYLPQTDILKPQEIEEKSYEYHIPSYVSGDHRFMLYVKTESGNLLGLYELGRIKVDPVKSDDGMVIEKTTCDVHITGDESGKGYSVSSGVDIEPKEELFMFCKVRSLAKSEREVNVKYEIYTREGKKIKEGVLPKRKHLKNGINEMIDFDIPHPETPQSYDTKIYLEDVGTHKTSNKIGVHYVVTGESGTIQDVSFLDEWIQSDGRFRVSVDFSGRADIFPNARVLEKHPELLEEAQKYRLSIKAENKEGVCAQTEKEVSSTKMVTKEIIDLKLKDDCKEANVSVRLMDKGGEVLSTREIQTDLSFLEKDTVIDTSKKEESKNEVQTQKIKENQKMNEGMGVITPEKTKKGINGQERIMILLGVLIVLIILILLWILRTHQDGGNKRMMIFFLLLGGGLSLVFTVKAYTMHMHWHKNVQNRIGWEALDIVVTTTPDVSCSRGNINFHATVPTCENMAQSMIHVWYKPAGGVKRDIWTAYSRCNNPHVNHGCTDKGQGFCKNNCHGTWRDNKCWTPAQYCDDWGKRDDESSYTLQNVAHSEGTHSATVFARYSVNTNTQAFGDEYSQDISYTVDCHVNGQCGSSKNSCRQGNFRDRDDTTGEFRWSCLGENGGHSVECSLRKPSINGVCGNEGNTCVSGNFSDISDTKDDFRWVCGGVNGGQTAQCSKPRPYMDYVCGVETVTGECENGAETDWNTTDNAIKNNDGYTIPPHSRLYIGAKQTGSKLKYGNTYDGGCTGLKYGNEDLTAKKATLKDSAGNVVRTIDLTQRGHIMLNNGEQVFYEGYVTAEPCSYIQKDNTTPDTDASTENIPADCENCE